MRPSGSAAKGGKTTIMAAPSMTGRTSLSLFFDGKYWKEKEQIREYLANSELFNLKFDLPLTSYRQLTFKRSVELLRLPVVSSLFDEWENEDFISKSLAFGETASCCDLSVGVKMGVMAWLFGGAITNLGTQDHIEKFWRPIKDLKFTGMFAMSERGHGSNVRGIQTEAHYDHIAKGFIIKTPTFDASKIYIGNALQGQYAAVFAQLYVNQECKGPHCFIVPIRDGDRLLPGITVQDMGMKEGLNGVDNGLLSFDHVRIPKENLLNRFADILPNGEYTTTIPRDGARFNAVLAALLGTRIALCFQALSALKVGLEIAVKYGLRRRQFGAGEDETLIMDYQTHQLRLMPRLATCLALMFTTRYAGSLLSDDVFHKRSVVENRPLQALAAGLKAYATWEAVHGLQSCRECTGGMGYMEVNRISSLKRDADVFCTFEGDNMVLLQQVTKELLTQLAKKYGNKMYAVLLSAKESLLSKLKTSSLAINFRSVTSPEFVRRALLFKESDLLRALAARLLSKVTSSGEDPLEAWNECLDHNTSLAWCHVHRVTLEQFSDAVARCPDAGDKATMKKFLQLYAVHLLYMDRAWYLEQNYLSPNMSKQLRDKYIELCRATKEHALEVVTAFRHPSNCVHAPIAGIPTETDQWAYFPDPDLHHGDIYVQFTKHSMK